MPSKSRQRKSQGKRPPETPAAKTALTSPAAHKPWQIAVVCIVLAVVTAFAYHGVRAADFVTFDDLSYVLENKQVQQGVNLQSVEWAFTSFYASNWHPLTWISHMIDWNLYGDTPAGHHITNLCLHAANAILLFLLLLYMTGYAGRSAIVAFLFALHPAHVESVAWISERKDVLCAFFFLATLLAYAWYVRRPSWKRFAWVIFGFACAIMSKPMAVTLPLVLLLLDYWPLRRITFSTEARAHWLPSLGKLCLEKWLLFLMAAISSVLTFFAQRAGGMVIELHTLPLWERLSNAAISYWRYVRLLLWPNPLRAYYYYDANSIMILAAVLSCIALILVTILCWRIRKERPYCLIGWLWFLGTLAPVIGIVQVADQAMAERYSYIPSIGLFAAIVWLVADAVAKSPKIKAATLLLAVAVLAAYAAKTDAQVKVWKDSVTLFRHALAIDPRGGPPNLGLAMAYARLGNIAEAEEYYEHALTYYPSWPLALSESAYCMMRLNDPRNLPLAGQRLERALSITPDDPGVQTNMALWYSMMGRPKDSETYSRKAVAGMPNSMQARLYLADALQAQGKFDEAVQENRQVLRMNPDLYDAHNNLGFIFDRQGLEQDALKEFRLSLAINPDQAAIHSKVGRILAFTHQLPEAIEEFTQAVRFEPANAYSHNDLGVVLFQEGDYENAAVQFSDAVRINPAYSGARQNLDLVQAKLKNKKIEQAEK
jgi:tetratricopeptide (TPR) repeat protein